MSDDKLALLIFVVLTITAPVIFVYLTHSSPWSASIKSCNGLAGPFLSSVFLVFGLNLVFLANEVWGAHDRARAAAALEGDTLRNIARAASGLKSSVGRSIVEALNRYELYTINEDWSQLGRPNRTYGEGGSLADVTVLIGSADFAALTAPTVQSQLLNQINNLRSARNIRYALAEDQLNPVKWYFAYFIDIVAILTVGFGHLQGRRPQIVAFVLFFTVSTPTLVLLNTQANPFRGLVPVAPTAIQLALDHSNTLLKR